MPDVAYRLPVFNLAANVWRGALPDDLLLGLTLPPADPPDYVIPCQLYVSRYGTGGRFHADPAQVVTSLRHSGWVELRCPKDSPIQAPWLPNPATTWADVDLVEVPAGSRRFYGVVMVEQQHAGFPNEYRVGILTQLADLSTFGIMGGGGALELAELPPLFHADLAGGGGLAIPIGPPPATALDLAGGGGLASATGAPPPATALDLAGGGGLASATGAPPPATALDLAGGGGMEAPVSPPAPTPETDCWSAGTISLPFDFTFAIAAGVEHFWPFVASAGVTYRVRITINSGTIDYVYTWHGTCDVPGAADWYIDGTTETCAEVTPPALRMQTVIVSAAGSGPANYRLRIDVGTCP